MADRTYRRLLPDRRDEAGFTLVELVVVMAVFGLVATLLTRALVTVQGYAGQVEDAASAVAQARLAVEQIDRQVRSGNVLYSPAAETTAGCTASGTDAGTCMRVYTQADGIDRCVQWQLLADAASPGTALLRERTWSPSWVTDHDVTGWSTQARGLVLAPSAAPFRLQTSGAAAAYGSRLLDVRIEARDARNPDQPAVLTSSVSGRNTNYGYDGGQCTPVPAG